MSSFQLDDGEPLSDVGPSVDDKSLERMWPLDVALAALGGLVIYTVVTRLNASDTRILYNPITYAVLVPLGVVGLSLLLRNVASRFVRRSMQLGFLLSVMVHLLLLIAFFNVMILAPFWPSANSNQERRAPTRKTVPDYLFARSETPVKQPDWSRPVDAAATSREAPDVERRPQPLETKAAELQMPQEQPRIESVQQPTLTPKRLPQNAMPTPADSAAELSRQVLRRDPQLRSSVDVPDVSVPTNANAATPERSAAANNAASSARRGAAPSQLSNPAVSRLPTYSPALAAPTMRRQTRNATELPEVGAVSANAATSSRTRDRAAVTPAGAAPSVPSLSVARDVPNADRALRERSTAISSSRGDRGAPLSVAEASESQPVFDASGQGAAGPIASANRLAQGMPEITAGGQSLATPRRPGASALRGPEGIFGAPDVAGPELMSGSAGQGQATDSVGVGAIDRLANNAGAGAGDNTNRNSSGAAIDGLAAAAPSANIDLAVRSGPGGLSRDPSRRIGFAMANEVPEIPSIDFGPMPRRRRDIGGPVAPAGSEVTGVRPFDRRTMRTAGGAAPAPVGLVGPETEEAIELGLAYLAERQNENGSWSLQGHGEEVEMQSDTAATGLCLLAFQGAGYTHKQHQYADTVARGLQFLVRTQRTNGDLYKRENKVSDTNAWLYSHGIASLALCEAYGMTSDPELARPAQKAIDFIALAQDPRDGGWRYQPRQGSDTSVTGWMMMALKSGELAGLEVPETTYDGIRKWLRLAQESPGASGRYRYNPRALDNAVQGHGLRVSHSMTAVGLLARMYLGWKRTNPEMQIGADYLSEKLPAIGSRRNNERDTYYWYYATQVMFHMGGETWEEWNQALKPILLTSQETSGENAGSWNPVSPVPDRWARFAGRIYVTTMNILSLEVYYRHLPIYDETAK